MLTELGIWNGPANWDALQQMPRYFPGRPIWVKTNVEIEHDSPNYMQYLANASEKFVTHRATLVGMDQASNTFSVEIDGKTDGPINVPVKETL